MNEISKKGVFSKTSETKENYTENLLENKTFTIGKDKILELLKNKNTEGFKAYLSKDKNGIETLVLKPIDTNNTELDSENDIAYPPCPPHC